MKDIALTNLIDSDILQKIQDSLSGYIGMAGLITDENGVPVTEGSNFSNLCLNHIRKSEQGCKRCNECDRMGALKTLESGKPTVYRCHAGLVDYAAPIMLEGNFIGSIIGGQVRTAPLTEDDLRQTARELALDEDAFLEAAREIPLWKTKDIERAAQFITEMASALSSMAYKNHQTLQVSRKMERAAHSQTAFLIDMNASIQRDMTHWIESSRKALENRDYTAMADMLQDIAAKGSELLSTLKDTVEYAKMNDGEIKLNETEYDLRQLLEDVCGKTEKLFDGRNLSFHIGIDDSVPKRLMGDEGRISQILSKLFSNILHFGDPTEITISASCKAVSYAMLLILEVHFNDRGMTPEDLANAHSYLRNNNFDFLEGSEADCIGLSIIGLLMRQLSGSVELISGIGIGTTCTIHIPQLPADSGQGTCT